MNHNKTILAKKILVPSIVLTILLTSFVLAFGVGTSYWKGNPLTISPGETKTVDLTLQNMVGTDDVTVRVKLTKGEEIASTSEKDYLVKTQTANTKVPIKIEIPATDAIGKAYVVTASVYTVTSGDSGMVALGIGMDTTFDVSVVALPEKAPEENQNLITYIVVAVVVIALIIIIVLITRRKK